MNKIYIYMITFLSWLQLSATEIPAGGENMILDAISYHSKVGNQGTITVIEAEHTDFNQALRIDVATLPENYWNFQVEFQTHLPLVKGDICLVSFWARTTYSHSESGEGLLTAIIEHNQTFEKPLSKTFAPGGEWKHFFYGFQADRSLSLENHKVAFFLGHAVQTIEVAKIQFLNYKNKLTLAELPVMDITWDGMEPDAPWRAEANQRIEKYRKGNLQVKLVDSNNQPVNNATVSINMQKHKFGFGSAIDGKFYLENPIYRQHVHELFGEVVFENDLKWRPWANRSDHSYILKAIDSLQKNGINIRGHNLIWPGWQYLPDYLDNYKNNPTQLRNECLDHIEEVATYTRGKLIDWDVLNEPYTNTDIQNITGDQVMADWFAKAKVVDPHAKLYINDYSIISNGGTDVNHQNGYFEIIEYIEENGGNIDGIGLQGHFSEFVTGIPKVLSIIDRFASFEKEIKITEFDINSTNDELKVNYTRDLMTACFSHPYVKGFLSWGFWAGRHWRPEAAYYDFDWNIRPQGSLYKQLVLNEWWTQPQSLTTDATGQASFGSCFLGTYTFEVKVNGKTIQENIMIPYNLENQLMINVDSEVMTLEGENHADTPLITSSISLPASPGKLFKIYPNPASNQLYMTFNNMFGDAQLTIINATGANVMQKKIALDNVVKVSLAGLKPGLYIVKIASKQKNYQERLAIR